MSGVVALFQRNGARVDPTLLKRMNELHRFRGPDGEGSWHAGAIGLGHILHKTAPESEREVSPTQLEQRLFISADARIDAREELCESLRRLGNNAATTALPDAELLLHAYDAWGEDFPAQLLGDFSFALWDARKRKLVCAVDQLGVKPLFYADRAGLFAASNTLECVRKHPQVRDELNETAIGDFLLVGYKLTRDITFYEDIARIPPGHLLVVEPSGLRLRRYFSLPEPQEVAFANESECVEQFEELLAKAVRDRMRTSHVAVFMSGGVDSPLVALAAKRELARAFTTYRLKAFTQVYDYLIRDQERHYAALVAKSLAIEIEFQAFDESPLFGWSQTWQPSEPVTAGEWGRRREQLVSISNEFSVALTGFDGDALMLASPYLHWLHRLRHGGVRALGRDVAWYVRQRHAAPPMGIRTRLAKVRRDKGLGASARWLRADFVTRTRLDDRIAQVTDPALPRHPREKSPRNFENPAWGYLFDDNDPALFRLPLDVRHPLADLRIVKFALGLPAVPWCVDKHLLRRCLHALPSAVRARPKAPLAGDPVLIRLPQIARDSNAFCFASVGDFLEERQAKEALQNPQTRSRELHQLLRAIALGRWLERRGNDDAPGSHWSSTPLPL